MFLFLLLLRAFITKPLWIWRLLPVSRSLCLSTTPSSLFLSVFHFLSSMERGERKYQQNWEDGWQVASFGENRSVRGCVSRCISIYAWTNLASDAKKQIKLWRYACTSNSRSQIRFQIRSSQMDGFYEALWPWLSQVSSSNTCLGKNRQPRLLLYAGYTILGIYKGCNSKLP